MLSSEGNAVFTYLLKKTSSSVQQKLKLKNTNSSAIKKISRLSNLGLLKNQQKREYSSGKPCLGLLDKILFYFPTHEVLPTTNLNSLNLEPYLYKLDRKLQLNKNIILIAHSLENHQYQRSKKKLFYRELVFLRMKLEIL